MAEQPGNEATAGKLAQPAAPAPDRARGSVQDAGVRAARPASTAQGTGDTPSPSPQQQKPQRQKKELLCTICGLTACWQAPATGTTQGGIVEAQTPPNGDSSAPA